MKNKIYVGMLLAILLFTLFALSGYSADNQKPIVWEVQGYSAAGTLQDGWGQDLAKTIEFLSNGRLKINWYPVGAIVGYFEVPNAIRDGVLDAEWGIAGNWKSLFYAAPLFTSTPGLYESGRDFLMWMNAGGGQELWEEALEPLNAVPMLAGLCDMELFMWSNSPISSLEDMKGKKFRMMPFMGEILEEHGMNVVFLPGNEVVPSLQRGVIDGGEYGTRATDIRFGFPDAAKYFSVPGVHQPVCGIEFVVNKDSWEELPDDLKEVVRIACDYNLMKMWIDSGREEVKAIKEIEKLGVQQIELEQEFVETMLGWIGEWMEKTAQKDEFFAKVWASQKEWGKKWFKYKDASYIPYPEWALEE